MNTTTDELILAGAIIATGIVLLEPLSELLRQALSQLFTNITKRNQK